MTLALIPVEESELEGELDAKGAGIELSGRKVVVEPVSHACEHQDRNKPGPAPRKQCATTKEVQSGRQNEAYCQKCPGLHQRLA
jgi:hypothetical protein